MRKRKSVSKGMMLLGVGAGVSIAAGAFLAKKCKDLSKEDIIKKFDEYMDKIKGGCKEEDLDCCENNIILNRCSNDYSDKESKYNTTIMYRRDRVNKKFPKGIKGQKMFY
ncbi:hypothetical protein [Clostridium hydrogeniformans]|uniref:hypothetical protein n=1 Tax=Clostridium hydrogeniformans TaxID=349933 RepID=UPI0004839831|nr:hypothetical protein [Clostridium hydrogeniformans]